MGDYFPSSERGKIYSFILTGELAGAGVGFAITGDIAALSWRAAFVILAVPAFLLAYAVFRLPEPVRGSQGGPSLEPENTPAIPAETTFDIEAGMFTEAQRLALKARIMPDPRLLRAGSTHFSSLMAAARYVLQVRTNVALILSGACAYYFLAGVETFGIEFVHAQYHVNQVLANGLSSL